MKRPWVIWVTFGAALAVAVLAMAWVSLTAIELDRAQAEARRLARLEENVRLALWRMDSAMSAVIAREIARPSFEYSALYRAGKSDSGLVASPLLVSDTPPGVLLYFEFQPSGEANSPQAPEGRELGLYGKKDLAEKQSAVGRATQRLNDLRVVVTRQSLLGAIDAASPTVIAREPLQPQYDYRQGSSVSEAQRWESSRSNNEYMMRQQTQGRSQQVAKEGSAKVNTYAPVRATEDLMRPVWVNGELLLARKVEIDGASRLQGCWLDWPLLRRQLLDSIGDLLPNAALEPVTTATVDSGERLLATLPVRLVPGPMPASNGGRLTPIQLALVVAWGCMLLAGAAVLALLVGALSLSERRGAFVSAVTHELRTPLTTFRMYAEMLERGMVEGEDAKRKYLRTLRSESERLSHLVDNVLSYARLEAGHAHGGLESLRLDALVERPRELLAERAAQAGMQLVVEFEPGAGAATVRASAGAVEQILFNLVDNACKYAAAADDRTIRVGARATAEGGEIRVCDHGPGIPAGEMRRLFRPFHKSARDAANSAPGVGLGLALSRRLARGMRGDLRIEPRDGGACFVLSLPRA